MKIKLSPELAYIIGLWKKCRSFDGLGVRADNNVLEVFSKEILDKKITTPDKMLTADKKVYFYHTAYRKFFQEVEKEQLERFKYLNEYAANYLAGIFDAVGEIDERGVITLGRPNRQDEMMLLRLGFLTKKRGEKLVIERPIIFLTFIKNYVKIKKDNPAFSYVK
ncbi:hypothetical protein HZC07_00880 [Candidatus Micrarchaeota archaeon]|nr:hypothetical protein [Candidatus Micrarchaeota archaeon]